MRVLRTLLAWLDDHQRAVGLDTSLDRAVGALEAGGRIGTSAQRDEQSEDRDHVGKAETGTNALHEGLLDRRQGATYYRAGVTRENHRQSPPVGCNPRWRGSRGGARGRR